MIDTRVRRAVDRLHDAVTDAEPRQPDDIVLLAVRLQNLHPHASPAMVDRSIDEAIAMFSNARVQQFLPILIERAASAALRTAVGSREHDIATPGRACGPPL